MSFSVTVTVRTVFHLKPEGTASYRSDKLCTVCNVLETRHFMVPSLQKGWCNWFLLFLTCTVWFLFLSSCYSLLCTIATLLLFCLHSIASSSLTSCILVHHFIWSKYFNYLFFCAFSLFVCYSLKLSFLFYMWYMLHFSFNPNFMCPDFFLAYVVLYFVLTLLMM